jgi:hypothetical protein
MREILFGILLAAAMAASSTLIIAVWPISGRPVAALFPDAANSHTAIAAIVQADGRLIDVVGGSSWIISVSPRDDYATSLYRLGAWLVIDARAAILCFGSKGRRTA